MSVEDNAHNTTAQQLTKKNIQMVFLNNNRRKRKIESVASDFGAYKTHRRHFGESHDTELSKSATRTHCPARKHHGQGLCYPRKE